MNRLQRKRTKGWKMLPNSRCVTRPSRWGNHYELWYKEDRGWYVIGNTMRYYPRPKTRWTKEHATQKAVELYREYATERARLEPEWLDPLRGLDNLYCSCPEGAPCHADVLIELIENDDATTETAN